MNNQLFPPMFTSQIKIMSKSFRHSISIGVLACILFGCSSTGENKATNAINTQPAVSHKIAIVNASSNVINSIQYRPCGSNDNQYQYLTGNLRPNEKLSINIYSQCVDLIATNAFKKNLVDVKNVDLSKIKTWTIK